MDQSAEYATAGVVVLAGVGCFLALAVYPFGYGVVESALAAAGLVALGLFETVLSDTSF